MKMSSSAKKRVIELFRSSIPADLAGKIEGLAKRYSLSKEPEERESINDEALAFIGEHSRSIGEDVLFTGYYGSLRKLY